MFNVSIPKFPVEEIIRRYKDIKPVITVDGKLHYFREFTPEELSSISYLWNRAEDVREEVGKDELKVWKGHDFACLHSYGYPGLFKPSLSEVLSQIKTEDLNLVKAFEIIESPKATVDFYKDALTASIFEKGFHVSIVRLYIAKE